MKPHDLPSYLLKILLLSLLYFSTARLGLQLDAVSGFATLFWLPTGISLAALLLFGYRLFPGILLGAFFANLLNEAPFVVACGIALGNTLEALLGAYLLKKFTRFQPTFERLKDVFGLIILAAFFSTMVSATIGVASLYYGGLLSNSHLSTWTAWWVGDMLSNLIVAPFLLVWSKVPKITFSWKRAGEEVLLAVAVVTVGVFAFWGLFGIEIKNSPLTYVVFPPLIWASLRFGPRETVTTTFALSLFAVWATAQGHGPFARENLSDSLLFLQSFMAVIAITFMILAAVVSERRILERRKDDFISFASHELKTPITSIKLYIQTLQIIFSKKRDKRATQYLNRIDKQLNKLIALINDMLDLSKMQVAKLELRQELFSLPDLIEEVIESIQSSTQRTIIKRGKIVAEIYGDKNRIEQVILNLLSNAIKYSPSKKNIVVSIKREKKKIIVSVLDYGIGISEEHQAKIFDRFYRVTEDTTQTMPGLGIGLYLSKMIIKRHGGEMWVKSIRGKGSTFSFFLPLSIHA